MVWKSRCEDEISFSNPQNLNNKQLNWANTLPLYHYPSSFTSSPFFALLCFICWLHSLFSDKVQFSELAGSGISHYCFPFPDLYGITPHNAPSNNPPMFCLLFVFFLSFHTRAQIFTINGFRVFAFPTVDVFTLATKDYLTSNLTEITWGDTLCPNSNIC